MIRHCDGNDPNLLMVVDGVGRRLRAGVDGDKKPCDCGLMFDDERRSVVWPHDRIGYSAGTGGSGGAGTGGGVMGGASGGGSGGGGILL